MVDGLGREESEGAIAGDPGGGLAEDRICDAMDSEVEGREHRNPLVFGPGLPGVVGGGHPIRGAEDETGNGV